MAAVLATMTTAGIELSRSVEPAVVARSLQHAALPAVGQLLDVGPGELVLPGEGVSGELGFCEFAGGTREESLHLVEREIHQLWYRRGGS
jgi:hypothetical protein